MIFRAILARSAGYSEMVNVSAPDIELAKKGLLAAHPGSTVEWIWPVRVDEIPADLIDSDDNRAVQALLDIERLARS
ncbi:hypothetical protein [Paraburkholderia adhaesiva]|uniref:hypothetical protein n=1 Tax=Paraburkholderia adhaesiva TaxID=2883244 RepID=UPI001F34A311|nr:hypothetical protein [Paraburkholderia adhaesiva]